MIFSPFALDPEHLAARSHDVAMVLPGQFLPDSTADYVAVDNLGSAADAVRHLVQQGRRRIGFLGAQPDGRARSATCAGGCEAALAGHGLRPPPGGVAPGVRFTRESGDAGVQEVLDRAPDVDALVCASDLMAIGAVRALQRRGRRGAR